MPRNYQPSAVLWPYRGGVADRRGYQFDVGEPVAPRWWRIAARVRGAASTFGSLGIIASMLGRLLGVIPDDAALDILSLSCLLLALGVGLSGKAVRTPRIPTRPVDLPARGSWRAFNSPADRVPSHGTHAFGQTFAIDLVPGSEGPCPIGTERRPFHRPEEFAGFGEEVFAPAAGRVVVVRDGARDHRSRSSQNALSFMRLEAFVRQAVGGARLLAGNLIVLDLGDGAYAALAHLKRRSATVRPGQQVGLGDVLGRCGNSGNSSQPHLHFQLMDHPRQSLAAGLPFTFTGISDRASPGDGCVPRAGEAIVAGPRRSPDRPAVT